MTRPLQYNTKQGEAILAYMASLDGEHITAGEIVSYFENMGQPIGLATIYRHLNKLAENGKIHKYTLDGVSGACYQYLSDDQDCQHVHLKCDICGEVFHLECRLMAGVPQHVYEEHAFLINPMKTVLYGKCAGCMGQTQTGEGF